MGHSETSASPSPAWLLPRLSFTTPIQNRPFCPRERKYCTSLQEFQDGITNGAAWYPIYGSMQVRAPLRCAALSCSVLCAALHCMLRVFVDGPGLRRSWLAVLRHQLLPCSMCK